MRWPTPVLCAVVAATPFSASLASHTPNPTSVTIAGSFQSALGCKDAAGAPVDWKPECALTHLKFDRDDDVWQGTFDLPAGNWKYKAALNDSWAESYGRKGGDITLNLSGTSPVKFYYDHKTHWIASNKGSVIVTAPGNYQEALGCPGNWQPDCLRSLLEDPDGDGIYTFTARLPAGSYLVKAALNESWDVNYGAGGAQNGADIPFTVSAECEQTTFSYHSTTPVLTVTAGAVAAPQPASVTIAGSFQSELGCKDGTGAPADWKPDCALTHLKFDPADDVWQGAFVLPAGKWEYKAALNDSWTESYGGSAGNITLNLDAPASVKFYYDHKTHWITSNRNAVIATAPGSYQAALGCPGNWQPDCLRSWLEDPDGDGIYKFTAAIPAGKYQVKVAINESWSENYGAGGTPNGSNIPFTVATNCQATEFTYDSVSHVLTIAPATAPAQPATVTIAGSLQSELGCAGDWDPACTATHLAFDATDGVWQGTFGVPAGNWEYKAALNGTWDENYGANATRGGDNIPLNLAAASSVKFYYDHLTHWIADNKNKV